MDDSFSKDLGQCQCGSISKSEKQHVNICSSNPLTCDVRVSESGYHKATFSTTPTFGSRSHPTFDVRICASVCLSNIYCASGRVHAASTRTCGLQAVVRPQSKTPACIGRGVSYTLGLPSSWQPVCQVISCSPETSQEGNPTKQRDVPYGGFGPDQPCYPPLSDGSIEV